MQFLKSSINLDNDAILRKINNTETNWVDSIHLRNMHNSLGKYLPHAWLEFTPLLEELNVLTDKTVPTKSWFSIMIKGSYIEEHCHLKSTKYVCNYYPKISHDHPGLEICINDRWQEVKLQTGDFVLFDKNLMHRVPVQTIDEPRIAVSINL